jgi:hypothetical protein
MNTHANQSKPSSLSEKTFQWGEVIAEVKIPLGPRGELVTFVKHYPWKVKNSAVKVGDPDYTEVQYHCEETSWGDHSLEASILRYIALKNLGLNKDALVSGICRALNVPGFEV